MRIGHAAGLVRPVGSTDRVKRADRASRRNVQRQSGLCGDNARDLPATCNRLYEPALAIAEERDVVNKVDAQDVGAVVSTRSNVVFPTCVRVGHGGEVSSAVPTGGRVDSARQGIQGTEVQVA